MTVKGFGIEIGIGILRFNHQSSYAVRAEVCSQKSAKKSSSNDSDRHAKALLAACWTCCSDALLICSITLVAACFSAPICSWCRVRLVSTLDLANGLQNKYDPIPM